MGKLVSWVAVVVAAGAVLGLPSCADGPKDGAKTAEVGQQGTLRMALQTTSASGKVYRLRQALFVVDSGGFFPPPLGDQGGQVGPIAFLDGGTAFAGSPSFGGDTGAGGAFPVGGSFSSGGTPTNPGTIFLSSETDPNNPVLETFLAPGFYSVDLQPGWFIEQVDNLLHTAAFVPADLIGSTFQSFDITSNQETFVQYQFLVDGERVSFGDPGRLIIGIHVDERTANQGFCGNGVVDPGESCDGKDLLGQTCASASMGLFTGGFLQCSPQCFFDLSACTGGGVFPDGGAGGAPGAGGGPGFGGAVSVDGGFVGPIPPK